jgi:hypothetical protein
VKTSKLKERKKYQNAINNIIKINIDSLHMAAMRKIVNIYRTPCIALPVHLDRAQAVQCSADMPMRLSSLTSFDIESIILHRGKGVVSIFYYYHWER